jgi:hypothetical protein
MNQQPIYAENQEPNTRLLGSTDLWTHLELPPQPQFERFSASLTDQNDEDVRVTAEFKINQDRTILIADNLGNYDDRAHDDPNRLTLSQLIQEFLLRRHILPTQISWLIIPNLAQPETANVVQSVLNQHETRFVMVRQSGGGDYQKLMDTPLGRMASRILPAPPAISVGRVGTERSITFWVVNPPVQHPPVQYPPASAPHHPPVPPRAPTPERGWCRGCCIIM